METVWIAECDEVNWLYKSDLEADGITASLESAIWRMSQSRNDLNAINIWIMLIIQLYIWNTWKWSLRPVTRISYWSLCEFKVFDSTQRSLTNDVFSQQNTVIIWNRSLKKSSDVCFQKEISTASFGSSLKIMMPVVIWTLHCHRRSHRGMVVLFCLL